VKITSLKSRLTVLCAAIAGSALLLTPVASASGQACNPGSEACVNFTSHGEVFVVHDYKADGHSTVGQIDVYVSSIWLYHDEVWNSNGLAGAPVTKNYELPESAQVRYRACLGERKSGEVFDCGSWHYDTANG
jgi:hypothetical protein